MKVILFSKGLGKKKFLLQQLLSEACLSPFFPSSKSNQILIVPYFASIDLNCFKGQPPNCGFIVTTSSSETELECSVDWKTLMSFCV